MPVVPYSAFKQFVQFGKETTAGTIVAPTFTIPVTKADFEDKPHFLDDKSWNGSMSTLYGRQVGTIPSDFSLSGNVYPDTLVPLLVNIMGDRVSTTAGAATTTSAAVVAGATSVSFTGAVAVGDAITLDTGAVADTVQVTSVTGTGPYVAGVYPPTDYAHASGVAAVKLNKHAVSLLNSGQGQPPTLSVYHYAGPGPNGARVYPGSCLSDLTFKWNATNSLFQLDAKGQGWPSQPAGSALTANPSGATAMPSWQVQLGLGGTAAAAPNITVMDGSIDMKRKLDPEYTLQGSQNPAAITRGDLEVSGKLTFLAPDDAPYQYMRGNVQPQLQIIIATGSGMVTVDMQSAAFKTAKLTGSKTAIEYAVTFDGVINTQNAGLSGGRSPVMVTAANGTAGSAY